MFLDKATNQRTDLTNMQRKHVFAFLLLSVLFTDPCKSEILTLMF